MSVFRRLGPLGLAMTIGQSAFTTHRHWQRVPPERRARLRELALRSRGRSSNLTPSERHELVGLVRGLELGTLSRDLAMTAARGRGRRR